ncbi:hypothetical protein AKJ56_01390 [candidate division MSBL1 archaeon SCGC-AAA382N08]|uniref:Uncharacterized protein n=1 Tax=candidate division MSBL1 archaeon SCGC-AAA382N08 TaxID=1698285 RepID=A0A133VPN5_9EURY|nr:hypothetical protein AKJ56_01390 [candidate division MSBL1 archaeon SCGC-AAA382N08]
MKSLNKVLSKPFPGLSEVEKYVPAEIGVKKKYEQVLNDFKSMPKEQTSRKVLLRVSGSNYREYRKMANILQEELEKLIEFLQGKTALASTTFRELEF